MDPDNTQKMLSWSGIFVIVGYVTTNCAFIDDTRSYLSPLVTRISVNDTKLYITNYLMNQNNMRHGIANQLTIECKLCYL